MTETLAPTSTVRETATRVVRDYLGIRPQERFVIVVDWATSREIPDELMSAAIGVGAEPTMVRFPSLRRSGEEPPLAARAAMRSADVVLCAASTSLYHTRAKAEAERSGARGVFNAPHLAHAWRQGAMTADFFAIRRRAEHLAGLMRSTREVRVTSPAGTDLTSTIEGREPRAWLTGICRNRGEVSALPGGEVSLPPIEGTSEGVVVWEKVASDLGRLPGRVRIIVERGRAIRVDGGNKADELRDIIRVHRDANNIAEIGIGLNPAARVGGGITEAKKAFGTVHIALGDSANEYGGLVECDVHLDGLVMAPTVTFDGVEVVVRGDHVYPFP